MSEAAFKVMLRTVLLVLSAGYFASAGLAMVAYMAFAARLRVDELDLRLKRRARTGGWLSRAWRSFLREDQLALADPQTARIGRVFQYAARIAIAVFCMAIAFILVLNVIRLVWGLPGVR